MKQVFQGNTDQIKSSGISVRGISLDIFLKANDVNVSMLGDTYVALQNAVLEVTIKQAGKTHVISDNLRNLLYISEIGKPSFEKIKRGFREAIVLVTEGVATKSENLLPLFFDFGTVLNIKDNDSITAKLQINNGFFDGVSPFHADLASSYVQMDWVEGIGVQHFVPMFKAIPIPANTTAGTESLGSNITKLALVSFDAVDESSSNRRVEKINLTSDKYKIDEDAIQLKAKKRFHYATETQAIRACQDFILHEGLDIDNVELKYTLNAPNVNSSQNQILWRYFELVPEILSRAEASNIKHLAQARNKIAKA